jgi:hypothetical protein
VEAMAGNYVATRRSPLGCSYGELTAIFETVC